MEEGGGAAAEEAKAVEEFRQALAARDLLPPKFDEKYTMRRYAVVDPCHFCLFLVYSRSLVQKMHIKGCAWLVFVMDLATNHLFGGHSFSRRFLMIFLRCDNLLVFTGS